MILSVSTSLNYPSINSLLVIKSYKFVYLHLSGYVHVCPYRIIKFDYASLNILRNVGVCF
jgi:hypothetical protein